MADKSQKQITLALDILKTLTDNLPDMLWIKDIEGRYLFANKAICDGLLMAKDTQEPIGKNDVFFALREREKHAENSEWHTFGELCFNSDEITVKENRPMRFEEYGHVKGKILYLEVHKAPFYDDDGKIIGVAGSGRDITDMVMLKKKLEEHESELEYQATHDFLTGLPNRQLFQEQLEHILKQSLRTKKIVALFFIDLDQFKDINDIYGHDIGDEVLKHITHRLVESLRDADSLSRLGGDEFTLIIENVKDISSLKKLADKLLRLISKPVFVNDVKHRISASIGISLSSEEIFSGLSLLKHADSAMYKAKASGKNRYEFYTNELTETAFKRVMLEAELRTAIKEKQFEVFFQPKFELGSGMLHGAECLVRWRHPKLGLLTPDAFIPCAEITRLIIDIDRWVYSHSLMKLGQWRREGLVSEDFVLALNLVPCQLEQEDFLPFFEQLLEANEVNANAVELEVTETQMMTNIAEIKLQLQAIEKSGIRLAIDDFGTGYSSLSYLKQLKFDTLKIDRSFISDVPNKEEDTSIVLAIIAMAKTLGLEVVAEGVETEVQLEFLKKQHCDCAQGYLFSKPKSELDFEKMLKASLKTIK